MTHARSSSRNSSSSASLGFEAKPWLAADKAGLDKRRLGEIIDLVDTIELIRRPGSAGASPALIGALADQPSQDSTVTDRRYNKPKDIIGRVYEYFLGQMGEQ